MSQQKRSSRRKKPTSSRNPSGKHPQEGSNVASPDSQSPPPKAAFNSAQPPKSWYPIALLMVLAFVLYGNTLSHEYALDDAIVITENDFTQEGFAGIGDIMTTDAFTGYFGRKKDLVAGGRYRPLSIVTFAVEQSIFGGNPHISHFLNILLYGLTCVLLYWVLLRLFPPKSDQKWYFSLPFLVSVLFLAHPLHTEVVANIKGRDEIMALLFSLLSLYLLLRYLDNQKVIALALSGGVFFLGLLSKETTIPFLLIIPLTFYFFRNPKPRDYAISLFPLVTVTFFYFMLRSTYAGGFGGAGTQEILNDPFLGASFMDANATIFHTLGKYLQLLFVPHPLTHDYYFNQIPIISFGNLKAIIPLILYIGIGIVGLIGLRKKKPYAYAIWFFLLSLSIVSNLFFPIGTTMGERFLYVPSIGFLIILVILLQKGAAWVADKSQQSPSRIMGICVSLLLLAYAGKTFTRNPVWKNNFTLFTNDANISSNSAKVQTAAGGTLIEAADSTHDISLKNQYLERSIEHLNQAISIYPEHGQAWLLLGNALYKQNEGNIDKAIQAYETAVAYRPGLAGAHNNLAILAGKKKDFPKAIRNFRIALKENPKSVKTWYDMGLNYEDWGKADSAIATYRRVIALQPNHSAAYGKLGMLYGRVKGDLDQAISNTQKAIDLGSKEAWLFKNLGIAYAMKKEPQNAIKAFKQGIQYNPREAGLMSDLAYTYQGLGDSTNAKIYYDRAYSIDPNLRPR